MECCSLSYAAKKIRILYDKGRRGWHVLKGIKNRVELDQPDDILCSLCDHLDLLLHWLSGCQHLPMVECRREIIASLPHPEGNNTSQVFGRAISTMIPRLLITTHEPERGWTSNFLNSFRCPYRRLYRWLFLQYRSRRLEHA